MPITAFALGTWQVQRRAWKLRLISDVTEKINSEPATSLAELESLRTSDTTSLNAIPVRLTGRFDHRKEMLIGPRQFEGQTGFHVVTPFQIDHEKALLVNRGWIAKDFKSANTRIMNHSMQTIFGLIREDPARNMFTPDNDYLTGVYYAIDIEEMSKRCDTEPLLVEITIDPRFSTDDMQKQGIPIGRPHEVLLKNNHMQYILTWYSLAGATLLMSISLLRKKTMRSFSSSSRATPL